MAPENGLVDGVNAYQLSFGLASVQVHSRSQGTLRVSNPWNNV
jgi:hypothetical protein